MARNWINCSHCGKRVLVRVASGFCSPECRKKHHREREVYEPKQRKKHQTEARKYQEKMGEVRL
jgi:endogenous inhibitor of DNA gyrase (YacG/DUF329 family)